MSRPRAILEVEPTPPKRKAKVRPRYFVQPEERKPGSTRAMSAERAATAVRPNKAARDERHQLLRTIYEAAQQGRECAYTGEPHDNLVRSMRMCGCTRDQVSAVLCIKKTTLDQWLAKFPSLLMAWHEGGDIADGMVASRLFQRAIGYDFEAEKIFCNKDGDVTRVTYTEHVPPDIGAATVWLTNRQHRLWKNRRANEISGPDGEPMQLPQITILPVVPAGKEPPPPPVIVGKEPPA